MSEAILLLPVGSALSRSSASTLCWRTFCTSTNGDSPVTVIVSSRDPTGSSAFTVAVKPAVSTIPSRINVLKPGKSKVMEYVPGRRSTML